MAAPVLAGQTLADPNEYKRSYGYRGGRSIMADGALVTDLVSTGAKLTFALSWTALDDTELTALLAAFAALKDTSGSYTDISGSSYTVTLDEGYTELELTHVRAQAGNRWAASLKLRQV